MAYTFRGAAAEIKWKYFSAATLGAWTLVDGLFTAQVVSVDAFRVSQSPLTLVIANVIRPIEGLQIADGTLTARLGSQENVCPAADSSSPTSSASHSPTEISSTSNVS